MFNDRADQAQKILAYLRSLGWQPTRDGSCIRAWPNGPRLTRKLISATAHGAAGPLGRDVVPMTHAVSDVATLLRGEAELASGQVTA